ncbi:RTA1-domain-containing protein [Cucurbitaria berberidis CBS 394.84]|uniref:RTA1-domain-containing protein n=1 Tax=Cucurbitaria berberidis CBS 394.84 TaxID=1168544 RepID=A0A9P4GLE6_9PLEO|nr:RTA1-domain-containing protein [Cucurbitaria berberidis CBS 394.84]KAF1847604.1 RTA1-domain-containing protein [Cucurbitaria berberidis CBS 394.84]
MPTLETYHGAYLWKYVPNPPAAITFAILFLFLTIAHTWKMLKHRTWYCLPFVIGGICEPVGYGCRALATYHTGSLVPYLLQAIFLLLPPCLFAGTLYMVYSRVVRAVHGERFSLISPKWCTRFFVAGDFLCLNIQSGGAGFLPHPKVANYGNGIIVAGLGLQVVIFGGFMYCCILFHKKFRAHLARSGEMVDLPWESILWMLYVNSVIVSVRNIFRLVEFITGHDSYLNMNEWPVYVFDGVLMLIVMICFYVWYPPQLQSSQTDSMIELTSEDNSPEIAPPRVAKYEDRTS